MGAHLRPSLRQMRRGVWRKQLRHPCTPFALLRKRPAERAYLTPDVGREADHETTQAGKVLLVSTIAEGRVLPLLKLRVEIVFGPGSGGLWVLGRCSLKFDGDTSRGVAWRESVQLQLDILKLRRT